MTLAPTLSLKQMTFRASAWTFGGHVSSQVIRLGSNLIMTRLLVPEMFGVMAIASMVMVGLQLFSDFGLRQNVVQSSRGADPDFLNTIWVIQIIRGVLMWLIATLLSLGLYYAAKLGFFPKNAVYMEPVLPLVIMSVSITALISGFESTKLATATRLLVQGRLTLLELASQLVGIVVMILWVLVDRSIWALVAGGIAGCIVKTVSSHLIFPGAHNRWMWDKSASHEIFHFGKWIFISSVLGFLLNNGDRLLLGGMISANILGIYVIAFFIKNSMAEIVGKILASVAFPTLSETVRTNPEKLAAIYYKFRIPFDIVLLFLSGLFFVAGRYVIYFLYDARYSRAGMMLQILSLTLVAFRYNVVDECYLALGKPKLLVGLISIRTVTLFILLPLAFKEYQMSGALWAIVASAFSSVPLTLYFKKKLDLLDVRKELFVLPAFIIGAGVGFIFEKIIG